MVGAEPFFVHLLLTISVLLTTSPAVLALSSSTPPPSPLLPTNPDDVIRQAAVSIAKAYTQDGIHLQTIRIPLSEAIYGDKEEGFVADRAIGWQGGPQETLRYLSPLVSELLKRIETADNSGGLVAKVTEQTLLDFDGSALQTSEHPAGPRHDVQALLQPNTDGYYLDTIAAIKEQFSSADGKPRRLFLLVNPAWRDRSSWGFFGGKRAQERVLSRYAVTYAVDRFVVRGRQVSLLKCWAEEWALFVGNNGDPAAPGEWVARFPARPDYREIETALTRHAGL